MTIDILGAPHALLYVLAAAAICVFTSAFAFSELAELRYKGGVRLWRILLAMLAAGVGVWATHFVAMLGYRPDARLAFAPAETLGSAAVAVVAIGLTLVAAALAKRRLHRLSAGAGSGLAVSAMHHMGMAGLAGCAVAFDAVAVAVSTLLSCLFSAAAAKALHRRSLGGPAAATAFFTLAVVALHFGSVAGTTVTEVAGPVSFALQPSELSQILLATALLLAAPALAFVRRQVLATHAAARAGRASLALGEEVLALDPEGRMRWANSAFVPTTALLGCLRVGRPLIDLLAADQGVQAALDSVARRREAARISVQLPNRDGSFVQREATIVPVLRRDGALEETIVAFRDTTAERAAYARLEASEAQARRLALVARQTGDAVLITDEKGEALWVNPAFERLTGYTKEEFLGRRAGEVLQGPATDRKATALIRRALDAREPIRIEILNYSKTGEAYWVDLEISPAEEPCEGGSRRLFIGVSREITETIRQQKALTEARNAAEAAGEAKSEFLARVSHELRTPLNGVLGTIALLGESGLDARQKRFFAHLESAASRLSGVIERILEYNDLARAEETVDTREMRPADLLREVLAGIESDAEAKGLGCFARVDPALPVSLFADRNRLRRILSIFAENAVSFTERGELAATAALAGGSAARGGKALVRFAVEDCGPGVPDGRREAIFEHFEQADGSARRAREGVGLGLAIARRLADGMGARLGFDERAGGGSVFWVEIEADVAAPAVETRSAALAGRRALLIDPSPGHRASLADALRAVGLDAAEAETVDAALALARGPEGFDLIVADEEAVGEEAEFDEALARLRGAGLVAPIAVVTSERAAPPGAAVVIASPVSAERLSEALTDAIRRGGDFDATVRRASSA